ncbi:MAG TPA: hypothetical protein VKH19_12090 [Gemmatimonadaceae bacterium]|nr:hypothetical protein [Gemmatimonadaceae bacterium]
MSIRISTSAIALSLALTACATTGTVTTTSAGDVALRKTSAELHDGMRKLWSDHVLWTREYIIEAVSGNPAAPATLARLMRNQEDIGNAIAPYYGTVAGTKLTDLLKQHISIAGELVAAAKAGDNAKVTNADLRWHQNAADIAGFLSGANPNWPRETLLTMLNRHLALTTQEATAQIQNRFGDSTALFDQIFDQAIDMADALSGGIVKQYPTRA